MQRTAPLLAFCLTLALVLSACAASATPTQSAGEIYTQVAATLTAAVPATALPSETPVASATSSPTIAASPTATLPQESPLPTRAVVQPVSQSACDNSAYVSDVTIPDGTVLAPSQTFTKTWNLQNTGTCAWTTAYALSFLSGNSMSGSTTSLSDGVSSGAQLQVSLSLTAPSTAGTYTGYWRLQNASGVQFGQSVYVQIVVSGSTLTPTPTASATSGSTATFTPTSAETSTATSAPTSTNAPSATATIAPTDTLAPSETPTP